MCFEDILLSPSEIGAILNVPLRAAQRLCAAGKLPAINVAVGKRKHNWRVWRSDLHAFTHPPQSVAKPSPASVSALPPGVKRRV